MRLFKVAGLLTLVALCLFGDLMAFHCDFVREIRAALMQEQWLLLLCLPLWCGTFVFLTFRRKDWPLIGLLLVALTVYFTGNATSWRALDAVILLAGVTLGKGAGLVLRLKAKGQRLKEAEETPLNTPKFSLQPSAFSLFLLGLIGLLALAAWWHVDLPGSYHGPRWMGLWNNPNIYGMLMGAGGVLAIGLLAARLKAKGQRLKVESTKQKAEIEKREAKSESGNFSEKRKAESDVSSPAIAAVAAPRWARRGWSYLRSLRFFAAIKSAIGNWQSAILFVAVFMLGVGLVMSYSRGAWLATSIGLLYLAWCYGKLKWRYVLPVAVVAAAVIVYLWGRTPDSAPWYVKRADLGRPSAQNRAIAWRAGLEIMRDHPLGVGWNQAVKIYGEKYSPPEGGPAALTMNSYLMLGTELGIPALLCFVVYVGLSLKTERRKQKAEMFQQIGNEVACRAGALVFAVAFWFDGGLFDLPTAALFWVLLELGAYRGNVESKKVESGNLKPE